MHRQQAPAIGLNKNAVNIYLNSQVNATRGPINKSPGEPELPVLKSYVTRATTGGLAVRRENKDDKNLKVDNENLVPVLDNNRAKENIYDAKENKLSAGSRIPRLSLKRPLDFAPAAALIKSDTKPIIEEEHDNICKPEPELTKPEPKAPEPKALESKNEQKQRPARIEKEEQESIEDIDRSPDTGDAIFLVSDVAQDIYLYMYELEEAQSIKPDFLKNQKIMTPKVRQRLIDWCIEINSQLKLLAETLYITIATIDRYFERVSVKEQSQVQLVAIGATLIASKYEEIYPPDIKDLIHLTQRSYSREDITRVELDILGKLNFDLGRPIPLAFLRRFSKAAHCDAKMHSIAKYLMELSLTEYECSHWKPSLLAAAALYTSIRLVHYQKSQPSLLRQTLSSALVGKLAATNLKSSTTHQQPADHWNRTLVYYSQYKPEQLIEPASVLCKILKRAQKSPQGFYSVKKNLQHTSKWAELKSGCVDELIKLKPRQSP